MENPLTHNTRAPFYITFSSSCYLEANDGIGLRSVFLKSGPESLAGTTLFRCFNPVTIYINICFSSIFIYYVTIVHNPGIGSRTLKDLLLEGRPTIEGVVPAMFKFECHDVKCLITPNQELNKTCV